MDTSKEYILMCEKAEKIQELWKPKEGDLYYGCLNNHKEIYQRIKDKLNLKCSIIKPYFLDLPNFCYYHDAVKYIDKKKTIWLPRQDDLQEMVRFKIVKLATDKSGRGTVKYERGSFSLLCDFMTWIANWEKEGCWKNKSKGQAWSMEQLWLSFVMSEKYQKQWDGKKWTVKKKY